MKIPLSKYTVRHSKFCYLVLSVALIGASVLLYRFCAQSNSASDCDSQGSKGAFPSVVNGCPAPESEWPATYFFVGKQPCTATRIGQRVILTAAHCVGDTNNIYEDDTLWTSSCGENCISMDCSYPADFQPMGVKDYALCKLDSDSLGKVILANNLIFERVSTSPGVVFNGENLTILGYGCDQGSPRPWYGLNQGLTRVISLPEKVTEPLIGDGPAYLCERDSGGGVFTNVEFGESSVRLLVGVASGKDEYSRRSFISPLFQQHFIDFAIDWLEKNNNEEEPILEICGLTNDAKGCMSSGGQLISSELKTIK